MNKNNFTTGAKSNTLCGSRGQNPHPQSSQSKKSNCYQTEQLSNLRRAPERPRKTREGCRATPGAMRFSVVCLVVWPELWLARGDPRLGKRPFIESIALSPYTPISPGALLANAIPQSSLSCSSNNHIHANSRTQAPSRQTFHHHQPTQQPTSSYQSHRASYRQPVTSYLWVVINRHFPLEALRNLSNRSPYCRSVPQRAGILQTATIILAALLFFDNPRNRRRKSIRASSRSREQQISRQASID